MTERINQISKEIKSSINLLERFNLECCPIEIDCNKLNFDFHNNNILDDSYFKHRFEEIIKHQDNPAIYWFEFDTKKNSSEKILSIFETFKKKHPERNTPAIYKYLKDPNTSVLYLGKSKNILWGRLIQHLGFHSNPASQGLLLSEWANDIDLKLVFKFIVFNKEMVDLISFYEFKLSQIINPLIGKHK